MEPTAGLLQDYLNRVINDPEHASLDLQKMPEEFQALGKELVCFSESFMETALLAKAIAKGNLNVKLPPSGNEMAGPLKALHASLKHLTWQTQQVAKGDYNQRVDFMGDFSQAFNTMTEQLERQRAAERHKTKALEQSNSLLKAIIDQISQWVIVMDGATSQWLYANRQPAEVMAEPEFEPDIHLWMNRHARSMAENAQPRSAELEIQGSGGGQTFSVEIHPLNWYGHNALAFMFTDISSERKRLCELQNAAYTDMLTQVFSRRYGMQIFSEWLAESRPFILCFADIDNLKYVNDQFGHSEGDNYILAVADTLRSFSPESVLCRLGGDEFMLLAQGWNSGRAGRRMEFMRNRLMNQRFSGDHHYKRSISYGIIEVTADNALPASGILGIADERMYEYKRLHKLLRAQFPGE